MSFSIDDDTTLCHTRLILFPFNGGQDYSSSSEALLVVISLITVATSIIYRGNEVSLRFATNFFASESICLIGTKIGNDKV